MRSFIIILLFITFTSLNQTLRADDASQDVGRKTPQAGNAIDSTVSSNKDIIDKTKQLNEGTGVLSVPLIPPQEANDDDLISWAARFREKHPHLFQDAKGILVIKTVPGSQGEKAGLQRGDIIISYDEQKVEAVNEFIKSVTERAGAERVSMLILRGPETMEILLKVGKIGVSISDISILNALFKEGNLFYDASEYKKSLVILEKGLKIASEARNKLYMGKFFSHIGIVYDKLGQYEKALKYYEDALAIDRKIGDRSGEGANLGNMGVVYYNLGLYEKALSYHEESLAIDREISDRSGEGRDLRNIGSVYYKLVQYEKALGHYEESLAIDREISDRSGEGTNLGNIGSVYYKLGQYEKALGHYEESLAIDREIGDRSGEGRVLGIIGVIYKNLGQYEKALGHYEESLAIDREIGNRSGEGTNLGNIGIVYNKLGQYEKALGYCKEALAIHRETGSRPSEGDALGNIGIVYDSLCQYKKALGHYEESLAIDREICDRSGEGKNLGNIGIVYDNLGQYEKALGYHEESLAIDREIGYRRGEGRDLGNMGVVYNHLGQYKKALGCYEEVLAINREIGDRSHEGKVLMNIGIVYDDLGQYEKALGYYEESLAIDREIGYRSGEGTTLTNIGIVYITLGQYEKALGYCEKAHAIHKNTGYLRGESRELSNLGIIYDSLGRHEKALECINEALTICREIGDRNFEGTLLMNIGVVHERLGRHKKALECYNEALAVALPVGAPETLWSLYNNLRKVLSSLEKQGSAILFGKQAINTIQGMRASIYGMEKGLQKSFLTNKKHVYKGLADLLIDEGRLPEAQQVLAMLKEEEYFDFIRRNAGSDNVKPTTVNYTAVEDPFVTGYGVICHKLAGLGREKEELLQRVGKSTLTDEDEARLEKLDVILEEAGIEFMRYLDQMITELSKDSPELTREIIEETIKSIEPLQGDLSELGHGAVLVHYLMTEKRLRMIVTLPHTQFHRDFDITSDDLGKKILAFRETINDRRRDPIPQAMELYKIIFGPIEDDLKQYKAETVMVYLTDTLRYLPLSALHDGNAYVAEKYRVVVFTEAGKSKLKDIPKPEWKVAGLGLTKPVPGFSELPAVKGELDSIIRSSDEDKDGVLPGEIYLDEAFTAKSMKMALYRGYPVLHIASHFDFKPGRGLESSLVLGDGNRLTLEDIRKGYSFMNVDLLTLSACNTAVGEKGADGAEVEGFGVLAQRRGAKGVLATLWPVADETTGIFMRNMYQLREEENLTKAEALQRAQIMFIRGEGYSKGGISDQAMSKSGNEKDNDTNVSDGDKVVKEGNEVIDNSIIAKGKDGIDRDKNVKTIEGKEVSDDNVTKRYIPNPDRPYAHPYFWAPFILMGNWR